MGVIGSFGPYITFETSDQKVLTFSNMKRTVGARWTAHNSILGDRISEYLGPELDKMTFDILLSAAHGVNPRMMLDYLEFSIRYGDVHALVIGGKRIGNGLYKILSMQEEWDSVFMNGELYECKTNITIEEYAYKDVMK